MTDQQGLPIAEAAVEVRGDATRSETKSVSNSDGRFAALGLPPVLYTVTVAHDGFTTRVYENLELTVNRRIQAQLCTG